MKVEKSVKTDHSGMKSEEPQETSLFHETGRKPGETGRKSSIKVMKSSRNDRKTPSGSSMKPNLSGMLVERGSLCAEWCRLSMGECSSAQSGAGCPWERDLLCAEWCRLSMGETCSAQSGPCCPCRHIPSLHHSMLASLPAAHPSFRPWATPAHRPSLV